MKIGIMLRHYEQHEGGVKVYTQALLQRLFSIDSTNQYVLMYQNHDLIGTYSNYPNVEEVAKAIPGTILWDQIAAPWLARKNNVDLIFNPKFTIPIFSRKKKIFVLHGSEWFVIPETFLWYDRIYTKISTKIYSRTSTAFISVSNNVKNDAVNYLGVDPAKIYPIHNGFDKERFRVIDDAEYLKQVKQKYKLPDHFILWVGQIYPPKNVGRLLMAFSEITAKVPHILCISGQPAWKPEGELKPIRDLKLKERVHFLGWVSHDDLPGIYNLSDLFVLPSLYEGFGIPLIEAMACGCPVLTSNTGSPPEVVENAGYLVNPYDVQDIANGMYEILSNNQLKEKMRREGLERAKNFSWDNCAKEVLSLLNSFRN